MSDFELRFESSSRRGETVRGTRYRGCLVGFLFLAAGCASAIDAPSAYETAPYLCDEAHAIEWASEVEACRAAGSDHCAGVMSFRGVIDEQPVRSSNRVELVTRTIDATSGVEIRSVRAEGRTAYYRLAITCEFSPDGTPAPSFSSNLNLEARGGNYLVGLAPREQSVQVDEPGEFAYRIQSKLTRGGTFEGCFHLFVKPTVAN
jgi:hypothetical protein